MKVSKERMVLHLPFDEAVGSAVAYNYAPNRTSNNDAVLSGDCEITEDAVFGNALRMGADGECSVGENLINFAEEFTLSAFIKPTSGEISFVMNYSGGNQPHTHNVAVSPSQWKFVAIQRVLMGNTYYTRFILDDQIVFNQPAPGVSVGCGVCIGEDDECAIDELKAWNRALSLTEIFTLQRDDEYLDFYVDGVNFKTYGVEVSGHKGLLDELERKDPPRMDWDSMHGEVVDVSRPHWQPRDIELECFIVASDKSAFIRAKNRFMAAFNKAGLHRLTCEYAGTVKPLEYDVYRTERVEVEDNWSDDPLVGTFTIALREPQPIKMVLKHICQSANSEAWFQCHTDKPLSVSWGDQDDTCTIVTGSGNATKSNWLHDANGNPLKVKHTFAAAGEYDIVIHGSIEKITPNSFTTNCIIVYGADGNI